MLIFFSQPKIFLSVIGYHYDESNHLISDQILSDTLVVNDGLLIRNRPRSFVDSVKNDNITYSELLIQAKKKYSQKELNSIAASFLNNEDVLIDRILRHKESRNTRYIYYGLTLGLFAGICFLYIKSLRNA